MESERGNLGEGIKRKLPGAFLAKTKAGFYRVLFNHLPLERKARNRALQLGNQDTGYTLETDILK